MADEATVDSGQGRAVWDTRTRVGDAAGRLLPFLVAPGRGEVEEEIRTSQHLGSSRVRIGDERVRPTAGAWRYEGVSP